MTRAGALAAILLAGGCFSVRFVDGTISCGQDGACPRGLVCDTDQRCRRTPADAAVDLAVDVDLGEDDLTPVDLAGADLLACGGPYQVACNGTACTGGACVQSVSLVCIPTGHSGGMSGLVCEAGAFVACGGAAQPCCQTSACTAAGSCCVGARCVSDGTSCGTGAGVCNTGSCANCGGAGKKCCAGDGPAAHFCTAALLACHRLLDDCVACGGAGQACCEGSGCTNGGCCDGTTATCVSAGDACNGQGTCTAGGCQGGSCGRLGQPPCGGGVGCTAPRTVDSGGVCVACGGGGQPCCAASGGGYCGSPNVCIGAWCAHCGGLGEPCCAGRFCGAALSCNAGLTCT